MRHAPDRGAPPPRRRLLADRDRLYARADAVLSTSGRPMRRSLAELKALVAKETA